MKHILTFLIGCVITSVAISQPVVRSKHALVINADTGDVVYDKNATEVASIASITKLMTCLVTLEAGLDLDEQLTITKEDFKNAAGSTRRVYLRPGTILSRREMILLSLMSSNNITAAALARTYPAGYDAFIEQMNRRALEIGMLQTHFEDSSGLNGANQSTVRDLAMLAIVAQDHPLIKQFSTQTEYVKEVVGRKNKPIKINYGTTNRLLLTDDWNIDLQKTGYTSAAGFCVTMMLTVSNQRFIIVLLNSRNKIERASDAVKLKYWIEYRTVPSQQLVSTLNPYRRVKHRM